jgi:hypothetical protein
MRKLLLGTTALAAAATLSANAALADVSISGYYEWKYQSTSADIAAKDGSSFDNDSEITFKFSNKTDSGLTIGMVTELQSDDGNTEIDESSLSISGGFGKLVLGGNDGVGDNYGVSSTDLPAEEIYATGSDTLAILNADISNLEGDGSKVAYHIPAMGGLTAGVSFYDSGVAGTTDSTQAGFKYSMNAGGASITLGGATGTQEVSGAADQDSSVIGVSVTSGNITANVSQASFEQASVDEESNGASIKFKVSDAMTFVAHTAETKDSVTSEKYTNSGVEVQYAIASGLTAYINVEDYDYKVGTVSSAVEADSGTASKLTIKATF